MSKKRVLVISQEMAPYTDQSDISEIVNKLPQYLQEKGMELRVLMPRFGLINERRHRLHEVVRLSGMNIIVDDDDYPLIIKVASLPSRLQVYFLDNEEFFKRKYMFADDKGATFEDNIDRMVFFCKGAIETVKKFGWAPDIVHCHGWMTSLVPLYLKTAYNHEPMFNHTKVVYSLYNDEQMPVEFTEKFASKASINNLKSEDLTAYRDGDTLKLHQGAAKYADAIILGSEKNPDTVVEMIDALDKPVLEYKNLDVFLPSYLEYFESLLTENVPG